MDNLEYIDCVSILQTLITALKVQANGLLKSLGNDAIKLLALDGRNLELKGRRLARAIGASKSSSTPWGSFGVCEPQSMQMI